jgi:hemoglobin
MRAWRGDSMTSERDLGAAQDGWSNTSKRTYSSSSAASANPRGYDPLSEGERSPPELKFAAYVALHLDEAKSVGETPDGVRLDLLVHGAVDGPMLNGKFAPLAAYMLVDVDGIGTLYVRAPLVLNDGAALEIEATVRYDFGADGYRKAAAGALPDSIVAGGLRFLTAHPRYLWLNRALCLGVGELHSREKSIEYDLYVIQPASATSGDQSRGPSTAGDTPLFERLGGKQKLDQIVSDFVDGLDTNARLNAQNPRIAIARAGVDPWDRKRKVSDLLCKLTGGPCDYRGRLRDAHSPMRLTEADWSIGGEEMVKALNKNQIPKADQDELLAMIETLKSDIVQRRW